MAVLPATARPHHHACLVSLVSALLLGLVQGSQTYCGKYLSTMSKAALRFSMQQTILLHWEHLSPV